MGQRITPNRREDTTISASNLWAPRAMMSRARVGSMRRPIFPYQPVHINVEPGRPGCTTKRASGEAAIDNYTSPLFPQHPAARKWEKIWLTEE